MKKKLFVVLLVVSALLVLTVQASAEGDDTLLVLFEDNGVPTGFAAEVAAMGGEVTYSHEVGFAAVKGVSQDAVASLEGVQGVEPNFEIQLEPFEANVAEVASVIQSPADPTSAFYYAWQWNMRAIDADDAWAAGYLGSHDVTVAILDSGIDYTHPDLVGLVDLSRSVSFVPLDDYYVQLFFPGAHPIADLHVHGTLVAATVASNGLVAAGVTSQTTLMGVKVCNVLFSCTGDAILAGILYATDNGADVIHMSLGALVFKKDLPGVVGLLVNRVINYARSNGATIVVAAGNESFNLDHTSNLYHAFCDTPGTICVSATGPVASDDIFVGPWYEVDAPAFYTNYGRSAIDVAAPGGNTGGWIWGACSTFSLVFPDCNGHSFVIGGRGTSFAAPHVSGIAAMLVEQYGRDPGLIKAMILNGAEDLGAPGVDPFYGKGRVNVYDTVVP